MRGIQRLANLTQTVMKDLDAKADAVADRITAGQMRHAAVLDQFVSLAGSIEQNADEAEAALRQISNGSE